MNMNLKALLLASCVVVGMHAEQVDVKNVKQLEPLITVDLDSHACPLRVKLGENEYYIDPATIDKPEKNLLWSSSSILCGAQHVNNPAYRSAYARWSNGDRDITLALGSYIKGRNHPTLSGEIELYSEFGGTIYKDEKQQNKIAEISRKGAQALHRVLEELLVIATLPMSQNQKDTLESRRAAVASKIAAVAKQHPEYVKLIAHKESCSNCS